MLKRVVVVVTTPPLDDLDLRKMTVVDDVASLADSVFSTITSYAASHEDGMVALLLLAGAIITFAGRTLLEPTVFLLGFVPTCTSITAFGIALVADQDKRVQPTYVSVLQSLVVVFALILGVLVGVVMVRMLCGVFVFLLCAVFGAILIAIVYFLAMQPAISHNGLIVWYAAMALAAIVTALISVKYPKTGVILGTSLDGAALAVFSVAHFLGHQPRILEVPPPEGALPQDVVPNDAIDHWWGASYAIFTLLLAMFGVIIQRRVAKAELVVSKHPAASSSDQRPVSTTAEQADRLHYSPPAVTSDTHVGADYFSASAPQYRMPARYLLPSSEEQQQLVTVIEPPRSPAHRRNNSQSSIPSNTYGATDSQDVSYSVIQNLGADPLTPSVQSQRESRD